MDANEHELIPNKELSDTLDTETNQLRRISIFRRIVALFAGVLLPIAAFGLGIALTPEWQSKSMGSYISMLLTPFATWPFWPFIVYSMICLVLVLCKREAPKRFAIRFGLYLGILWSLQYMIILPFGMKGEGFHPILVMIYGVIATLLPISIPFLFKKLPSPIRRVILYCLIVLILAGVLVGVILGGEEFLHIALIGFPIIASLVASPFWCFTVYLLMSIYAYRRSEDAKLLVALKYKILIGFGAILVYAGAWWLSIHSMLAEYAKLPTEPPDCYIATAAAKGHRRFVKSEDVVHANGKVMRVNAQLRYLKCGELMIKALFPRLHKLIRLLYDTVGPLLARCLARPVLADVVYILLKPAEWFVLGLFFVLFGRKPKIVEKFYRNK